MGRHRFPHNVTTWIVAFAVVVALTAAMITTVYLARAGGARPGVSADGGCPNALRVVTASSFAPVLAAVGPELGRGDNCVRLDVESADGRAAAARAAQADLWIPDDGAWLDATAATSFAAKDAAGSGTVLATSPIFMVANEATTGRIDQDGGSWAALAKLLTTGSGIHLVVRDPGGSGDGLVAVGAVAEAVWLAAGMDASALALSQVLHVTRTVTGPAPALPDNVGEVGLVPEYALLPSLASLDGGVTFLAGRDHVAMLRYTWVPSNAAAGDPRRMAGLRRLLAILTGSAVGPALQSAGLRPPDGRLPPGDAAGRLPALTAEPYPVLPAHNVDHVFATWYPANRKMNLLLVTDVSGSMGTSAPGSATPLIDLVRQGCRSVDDLLPDDAQLGFWEFGVNLDPPHDYRVLVPIGPMTGPHRADIANSLASLATRKTGTGLYNTILDAYKEARDHYQPGVPNQVMIFTDGRNEGDPRTITAAQLGAQLAAAKDPKRPVQLSVVTFGKLADGGSLGAAVRPVDGYIEPLETGDQVAATFIHLAAGGLHGS
jgi:hypothetical protein